MRFTKMHGAGNDYIYVDGFTERVADPAGLARIMSDRHCGIGGDGLILILPSKVADVRMRMFNVDGSEAEMCGNGVRCLAKYAYEHGLARSNPMGVETAAGIKTIDLSLGSDGEVVSATVDMGEPILDPRRIPVAVDGARAVDVPVSAGGQTFQMTCVSMGNPHAVIYVADVAAVDLGRLGPELERHAIFPHGANVACGTGACAVGVAGVLSGRGRRQVTVRMPGGELRVEWRESDNHVYLTGPAAEVFSGDWPA
jgi:diaminopimelate epimerase